MKVRLPPRDVFCMRARPSARASFLGARQGLRSPPLMRHKPFQALMAKDDPFTLEFPRKTQRFTVIRTDEES